MSDDDLASIEMIRESARGIAGSGSHSRVRALRFTSPGYDRATWTEMCRLGWPALRLPEESGGIGLCLLAYCALAEELGRGLVPEPLIPAILAASRLDGEPLARQLAGDALALPAWQDGRDGLLPDKDLAVAGGRVTATKRNVPMASGADAFLVIGASGSVLVAADAPGVRLSLAETQDGGHVGTLVLDGALCTPVLGDALPHLYEAALATAAYLLGAADAALAMTVDYLKTRVQFGTTIGSFQVLQHMAVDLRLEVEVTRASVEAAARQWDREGPSAHTEASVSRAKARASTAALKVTRDCIQLHGGIGFTDEHDIGLYLRRAMVAAPLFGGAAWHRANYARLRPLAEAA